MSATLTPVHDHLLLKVIKKDSRITAIDDLEDADVKGKVLAVGSGVYYGNNFVKPTVKVGDVVYWTKFADSDTPPELKDKGYALVRDIKILAVEK